MRLISCHITNYGKFHEFDFNFNQGLTEWCADNGEGKTTICSFIYGMFYDLETKGNKKKFVDREHYEPLNGGLFGGNIIFEYKGDTYRIERFFAYGKTKNELRLYKNNSLTTEFEDPIGLSIFGINEESFKTLLSINSKDIDCTASQDILTKLNFGVSGTSDDNNCDKALENLKTLTSKSTNKGTRWFITEAEKILKELDKEKEDLLKIKNELPKKYEYLESLKANQDELKTKEKAYNEYHTYSLLWKNYDEKLEVINNIEEEINTFLKKYRKGCPSKEEIEVLENSFNEYNTQTKLSLKFSENDLASQNEYERLKKKYANRPEEKEINEIHKQISELSTIDENLKNKYVTSSEVEKIRGNFAGKEIKESLLDDLENDVNCYKEVCQKIESYQKVNSINSVSPSSKTLEYILIISGALVFIVGLVLAILLSPILYALMGLGLVALVLGLVKMLKGKGSNEKDEAKSVDSKYLELLNKRDDLVQRINQVLTKFTYYDSNVIVSYLAFINDYKKYSSDQENENKYIQKRNEYQEQKEKIEARLNKFFQQYESDILPYLEAYDKLNKELSKLDSLSEIITNKQRSITDIKEAHAKATQIITDILNKYSMTFDPTFFKNSLDVVKEDRKQYDKNLLDLDTKKTEASDYKKINKLNERPIEIAFNEEEELEKLNTQIAETIGLISHDEASLERLNGVEIEIEEKINNCSELKDKEKILNFTAEEIKKAQEEITEKYIAPIKNKYLEYAKKIKDIADDEVAIDKQFNVKYDVNGSLQKDLYLSNGQISLVRFCLKMALIDNMYESEKPFVILDDPFSLLDSTNMKKVAKLVKEMATKGQIIYFTCHESRKLN